MFKNKLQENARLSQKGFSLINMILLLSAMSIVGVLQFKEQSIELNNKKAQNAGRHLEQLNVAINSYLVQHATTLRKMQDNDCRGVAGCTPTVYYCETKASNAALTYLSDHQCLLNYSRLIDEHFLPNGWVNENPWGSSYTTIVTRVPKPYVDLNATTVRDFDFELRAITVTNRPWVDDATGEPLFGFLSRAVEAGGADLAMTISNANVANGLIRRDIGSDGTARQVSWNADASMNPFINGLGLLVSRAGFEARTSQFGTSTLLLRDGSNALQGDLNMSGFRVNNVQDASIGAADGKNLSSVLPTWVHKSTVRVSADGQTVPKPDCSINSVSTDTDGTMTMDRGEPRIIVNMDRLEGVRSLGYSSERSVPGNSPYKSAQGQGRAFGAYEFKAIDNGASWTVNFRYYQDVTNYNSPNHNASGAPGRSQGLASVYCYYDSKVESGCGGEAGCRENGTTGPGATPADLNAPPAVGPADMAPAQSPFTDPAISTGNAVRPVGAGDVQFLLN